ncbi:MAG: NfeD family protein [Verrucomicrobiota bacterium]
MIEWWNELTTELKVFYGIGILALLVVALQTVFTLIGFDADGIDGGIDIGDFDSGTGIGLFSSQTIAAFFLGFGWVGVAALKSGLSVLVGGLLAFVCGLAAMFGMLFMLRSLLRLQSRGNLDYANAIGSEGTVYVTIPGSDEDGGGQIELTLQGRHITASARKTSPGPVQPGRRVRIVAVDGQNAFTVEPI